MAEDMNALIATAQRQADIVRKRSNRDPLDMSLALGAFGVVISELDASASRYMREFQLTDPEVMRVTVHPMGDQSENVLLGLPIPDSQPGSSGRASGVPQQAVGSGTWAQQPVDLTKRAISGRADKLGKDLEDTYAKLLDSARSVLASLAVRGRITRIEVRTAINQVETLHLWLVDQQRMLFSTYAAHSK